MKTTLVASLISSVVLARKHLVDSRGQLVQSPVVDDCDAKCFF